MLRLRTEAKPPELSVDTLPLNTMAGCPFSPAPGTEEMELLLTPPITTSSNDPQEATLPSPLRIGIPWVGPSEFSTASSRLRMPSSSTVSGVSPTISGSKNLMPCMYLERCASSPSLGWTFTAVQLTTARTPLKYSGRSVRRWVMSATTSSSLPPGPAGRLDSSSWAFWESRTSARTCFPACSILATTRLPTPPVAPVTMMMPSTGTGITGFRGSMACVLLSRGSSFTVCSWLPPRMAFAKLSTALCKLFCRLPSLKKATVDTNLPKSQGCLPSPALTDTSLLVREAPGRLDRGVRAFGVNPRALLDAKR
mmetsp:Transcript_16063/g.43770  ORF Transcript_16063/g.43770 Transcript_16063/m.43770 type:complete len:310 (+) Transcript_16063:1342-2271(+)